MAEARERLALALDLGDLNDALDLARRLSPYFGVAKVGLELFAAAGPVAVTALIEEGLAVFLDLKLHDIPTTVRRAARVVGALGARYVTLHAAGGLAMLEAGVEGLGQGAADHGLPAPVALGVSVLTSDAHASPELLRERACLAASSGCGGVVCAARDLEVIALAAPGLVRVVPGIRPAGSRANDQARSATVEEALRKGADLLVIGRPVTQASDPEAAAAAIAAAIPVP